MATASVRRRRRFNLRTSKVPPWLTSLVVHLVLLLLLALIDVVTAGSPGGGILTLSLQGAHESPLDGHEAEALESAVQIAAAAPETAEPIAAEPEQINQSLDALLAADLSDLIPRPQQPQVPGSFGDGSDIGASAASGSLGDGRARTSVFGLAGEGSQFVYVFDRSKSMTSTFTYYYAEGTDVATITPLDAAKAELLKSLRDLDGEQAFQIVFYNHEPTVFAAGRGKVLVPANPANRERAIGYVTGIYGDGGTNHEDALEMALRMRPDVIFLLTDGEQKDDPAAADVERMVRMAGRRTTIHVIQFCHENRPDGTLVQLARQTRGRHIFLDITRLAVRPGKTAANKVGGALPVP